MQSLIDELSENYRRCIDTLEIPHEKVAVIHEITHDIKGQGGIFDYPLITNFGYSLYKHTHKSEEASDNLVELIKAHVDGTRRCR